MARVARWTELAVLAVGESGGPDLYPEPGGPAGRWLAAVTPVWVWREGHAPTSTGRAGRSQRTREETRCATGAAKPLGHRREILKWWGDPSPLYFRNTPTIHHGIEEAN